MKNVRKQATTVSVMFLFRPRFIRLIIRKLDCLLYYDLKAFEPTYIHMVDKRCKFSSSPW